MSKAYAIGAEEIINRAKKLHKTKCGKPRGVTQTATIQPYLNEVSVVDSRGIATFWHILNHSRGRGKLVFKRLEHDHKI